MRDLKVNGTLVSATPVEHKTEKFSVRKFVLKMDNEVNGSVYTNYAEFQLVNNRTSIIEKFAPGQSVTVHFNLKGNIWNSDKGEKVINSLDAWKIEPAPAPAPAPTSWGQPAPAPAPTSWGQPASTQNPPF